jgi:hypothetical protein
VNCGAKALKALSWTLTRLNEETLPSALFPQPPVVWFAPERKVCLCDARLVVQKTRRKTVLSMTGPFIAGERVLECPACSRTFASTALLQLAPRHCKVAYDVLVFVGRALFQRYRTVQEVRAELLSRSIRLCASEIDYLGRKFVTYLASGHRQATPRICQAMRLAGGYILHLDATHEGDCPALMTGMDGLSKFVLANVKLPSENADQIVPFLRKLKADYGPPAACVHDMGGGICKAVAEVFAGTPDFVCHFHFLRDIGKDFLEPAYGEIRKHLRTHATSSRLCALAREARHGLGEKNSDLAPLAKAIKAVNPLEDIETLILTSTYSLSLWALQGKHSGDGYGFPFDRPLLEFSERLLELNRRLPEFLNLLCNDDRRDQPSLFKLARIVSEAAEDAALSQAVEELHWRCSVFDRLRKAMRIALPGGVNGINDDGTAEAISTIRQGVEQFRRQLGEDHKLSADPLSRKMAEQIDKYGDKLFADPITVTTANGTIIIYPQRTNNILEQFFRGIRRGHRRKTGNDSMGRTLQTMLADTPLVKNLDNPGYMKLLLDGKTNLEELFAEVGAMPSKIPDECGDSDRMLPGFRSLLKLATLPEQVVHLFTASLKRAKSN